MDLTKLYKKGSDIKYSIPGEPSGKGICLKVTPNFIITDKNITLEYEDIINLPSKESNLNNDSKNVKLEMRPYPNESFTKIVFNKDCYRKDISTKGCMPELIPKGYSSWLLHYSPKTDIHPENNRWAANIPFSYVDLLIKTDYSNIFDLSDNEILSILKEKFPIGTVFNNSDILYILTSSNKISTSDFEIRRSEKEILAKNCVSLNNNKPSGSWTIFKNGLWANILNDDSHLKNNINKPAEPKIKQKVRYEHVHDFKPAKEPIVLHLDTRRRVFVQVEPIKLKDPIKIKINQFKINNLIN